TATPPVPSPAPPAAPPTTPARPVEVIPEPPQPDSPPEPEPEPEPAQAAGGSVLSLVDVRRLWPDIVEATKQRRRVTWIHLTQNAQVVAVDAATLTLGFANAGARDSFDNGGSPEIVRQAAIDVVGTDWRVETIVDPGASADVPPPPAPAPEPAAPQPVDQPVDQPADPSVDQRVEPDGPPAWVSDDAAPAGPAQSAPATSPAPDRAGPVSVDAAREAIKGTRPAGPGTDRGPDLAAADADAHPDDLDADSDELGGADLLARELGAKIIEEIPNQ
ncbi:MAG: hypothetical protein Q8O61_09835, partial [Nocardioides sp.]|nr:hypothetical protein [Nocardioides sp.]